MVFSESTPDGPGKCANWCSRRIESQRNETLKSVRLVLLFAQAQKMINPIFDRFNMPVKHRGIGFQTGRVDFPESSSQRSASHLCAQIIDRVGSRKISAPPPGQESIPASINLDDLFVAHFVEMGEVIELHHRESFQMQLRIVSV